MARRQADGAESLNVRARSRHSRVLVEQIKQKVDDASVQSAFAVDYQVAQAYNRPTCIK